jgi:energy-converting hydrogenase Eha subunit C
MTGVTLQDSPSPAAPAPHPRPAGRAARCAVAALALAGTAWAVRAVWHLRLSLAGEPASGPPDQGGGTHRPLNALEDSYHQVASLGSAVTAVCAVVFLFWLDRVRDNARVLSGTQPRYGSFWLLLGWIVPVANLWIPRGVVADVHRSVFPERRLPAVVNWWWGLWLAGLAGSAGIIYSDGTDEIIARAYSGVLPLLAADLFVVAAAAAAALMVRTLTAAQQEHIARAGY